MSWLNPSILALAALALVPIILHFLMRERIQKIAFSAVRFLRNGAEYDTAEGHTR